jgi:hypothetical protein
MKEQLEKAGTAPELEALLRRFWAWFPLTPEEYAADRFSDREEYMFPEFGEMKAAACRLAQGGACDPHSLDLILSVMAVDHEAEDVLDAIVDHASDPFIIAAGHTRCIFPSPMRDGSLPRYWGGAQLRRAGAADAVQKRFGPLCAAAGGECPESGRRADKRRRE